MRGGRSAAAGLALAACLAGCATPGPGAGTGPAPNAFPRIRFAVISDPHVFDLSASSPGPALDRAAGKGMKLIAESAGILAQALADIAAERPAFVLVCGDLTREGERTAHQAAAFLLGGLDAAGIPVLVVPGNHDILNPRAARYEGDGEVPADGVSPAEFAAINSGLGYGEALDRDPGSLSYLAEPVPGLRVLALDACRYGGNAVGSRTDGRLRSRTLAWAARALERSRADGEAVVVFLHHAVVPHFDGMERWLDHYLLEGHDTAAGMMAGSGARLVFTGHGHAQDIVRGSTPAGPLWDVETGSLASWPNPWRLVTLGPGGAVTIESRHVAAIPSLGPSFAAYSRLRLEEGLRDGALARLAPLGVRGEPALAIARSLVAAGAAFYAGDEPGPVAAPDRRALGPWSRLVAASLRGFLAAVGTDREPADNDVRFEAF